MLDCRVSVCGGICVCVTMKSFTMYISDIVFMEMHVILKEANLLSKVGHCIVRRDRATLCIFIKELSHSSFLIQGPDSLKQL